MNGKVQIDTVISVQAKQAEKQIKDFNRAMSTIAGQKTVFINTKIEGAEEIQKRLKESIDGLKGIKFDNKGVMTQILGIDDARKALRQLEGELGKTAGNARAAIQNKIGRVSAYLGAYNDAIDYRSNQIRSGRAVSSQRQLGKYYNQGREVRLQQIDESLIIARQNGNYREQLSLLKEKVKLLEKIDKANRAKSPNPEIEETRKQIASIQQQTQANKALEAQQRKKVDYEKLFGKEVNTANGNLASQGGIMRNITSMFRRYISLYTLIDVGRKMAETTGYFEQQQVALEGILGSASEAQKAIDKIKSLALESPFQTKDLVAYTKQLSAYGIENDKLVDTMKDLADISAGLGVDMGRLILAYGQVKSAAVLRGQELRQFTEAGIPMVQALADKFTELNGKLVTTGEVFKLISERKVPFEMVAEVLRDMTAEGGKFFNMQENLTETLYGQIQKLKDVWTLALNDTGSRMSGALMSVVKALQGVLKHISGILASGLMVAFIAGARAVYRNWGAFTNLLTKSKIELKLIKVEIQNAIIRTNQAAAGAAKWKTALLGVGRVAKQIGRALMSPVGLFAMTALVGIWVDAREKATQFRRELEEIDKSFDKGYKKQVEGLDAVIGKLSVAAHGSKAYNEAMSSLKQNYGDYVNDSLIEQLLKEQKELENTGKSWSDLRNSIVAAMEARNEYEKHVARAEKAGSEVESDAKDTHWYLGFQSEIENATASAQMDFSYDKQKASRVNQAIEMAISDFFENGGLTLDDFKKYVEKEAGQYAPEYAKVLNAIAERYFNVFAKGEKWNKYVTETDKVKNDPYQLNKKAIEAARKAAADENEGKWKGTDEEYRAISQKNKDYDPFAWFKQEDEKYISAVQGRMAELYSAITDSMKGEEYKKAKADLETAFNSAWDTGKTKDIADAMKQFADSVNDPNLRANILDLMGLFVNAAGTKSGVAKQISTNIENDFKNGANVSARQKDFFNRYNPTDQNVNALRDQVVSEYQRLEAENKSHPNPQGEWKKRVDENTEEMGWLKLLASSRYYDVDLSKKNGGAGTEQDIEISEFISRLKDAYEVYKKATQAEGADMGLAYMQNDKKMQERFFNFFHGFDEAGELDIFKNEKGQDIKIGKSGQTIRDLLKDAFIGEGIEKGVIDFEKAIRKVGEAMIEYGKQNEKARRGFISAGKAYIKYADQISKDNVTAWIADVNKQFTDLGKTFERTNQQVELYRTLMKNGTSEQLGQFAGVGRGASMTPDSVRNAGDIQKMMALYNKLLREEASKNLKEGETLDESKLNFLSIDRLSSVSDIQNAIATVTERMKLNKDNFGLGTYGEAGNKLEALLKNQLGIIIRELQSISSEQYTGDNLADAIANAQTRVKTAIDITRSQEKVNQLYGGDHGAAMKGRMDAVFAATQSVFDEFLKSNNFEAMSQATRFFTNKDGSQSSTEIWGAAGIDIEKLKEKFRKIVDNVDDNILKDELEKKFRDLELKVLEFNAAGGDLGAIHDNIQLYKGAHQEAISKYNNAIDERDRHEENIKGLNGSLANAISLGLDKETIDGINLAIQQEKEELVACNVELVKMGENGINFEKSLKAEALKNIQANISKASQGLDAMQNAVMGVVNAAKSMAKAINKVYDVMHDGENPAWMQDMEGFLEDFGEAFQMLIAPIGAVIAMIMALAIVSVTAESMMTPLLIVMLAIIAAAIIVAAIVAAFQQHDRALEREIENLEEQIEDTQNEMKNLEAAAQRMSGFRKMNTEIQALSKNYDIYKDKLKQAALEEDKKNTDNDKVKEYKQGAQEALDEFLNSLKDATDEITGSVQDWASSLSEALRSAFQNGENAARAFRNTAIEMVGDIVNKIIEMTVLEPMIENAIQGLLGYSLDKNSSNYIGAQDRFKNSDGSINSQKLADYVTGQLSNDNAEGIYQFMKSVEGGYGRVIDFINNDLAKPLKEAWAYNSDTSELSGGIQGITEDTARTLEGLANSQLAQLVLIQRSVLAIEGSGFTQIQTSWFNDILNHQKATRIATESIKTAIDEMRNGIRPMSVSMS